MSTSDSPLNKAHQHVSNAEDCLNRGLLIPAAEEHYKSAEAFKLCAEQAGDEGTKRTLRMLYNEHSKSGKDLQRKIAKLKEEGKDPTLPQISRIPAPTEKIYTSAHPSMIVPPAAPSSSNPRGRLSDSTHTIDESYMVLGQQSDQTFNEFWKVFEGLLDNLSQPVAFATVPLTRAEPMRSHIKPSDDSPDKTALHDWSSSSEDMSHQVNLNPKDNKGTLGRDKIGQKEKNHDRSVSSRVVTSMSDNSEIEEVLADPDSPSGESFFVIPPTSAGVTTKLQQENASLKTEVESLRQKLDTAERMRKDQDQQIREGILQARREAQRMMNSGHLPQRPTHPIVDLNLLNLSHPSISNRLKTAGNQDREGQLIRKIKELEEEIKLLRIDNEKQKTMIVKFRERWEKLKESAKRKRNAKANAGLDSVREQRIEEEPEAEAEAGD